MFFRRERPRVPTFAERIESLRNWGFALEPLGDGRRVHVRRQRCAGTVEDVAQGLPRLTGVGLVVGEEVGLLVDGGYQKFFQTAGGKRVPALATDLSALHDFQEDLREALGLPSLYNESLGTECDLHVYDRVEGRESSN